METSTAKMHPVTKGLDTTEGSTNATVRANGIRPISRLMKSW